MQSSNNAISAVVNTSARRDLLGVLAVVFAAAACSSISLDQSPVTKPQFTVGDRWTMRTIDLWKNEETVSIEQRVASVNGDIFSVEERMKSPARGASSNVGATEWTLLEGAAVEGRLVDLPFPLYVGKTWQYEYKTVDSNGRETLQSGTAKVEGWEVVTVAAGTFKALKVDVEGRSRTYMPDGIVTGKVNETLWYSPEAKRWVKRESFNRTLEGRIVDQVRNELMQLELQK